MNYKSNGFSFAIKEFENNLAVFILMVLKKSPKLNCSKNNAYCWQVTKTP
ncbi:hypothetical protein ADICYQ_5384 [Cyclobacterium qasimii M12-11B]|uniref:Uncharacterized protein n=1 Tax=Cyclobacterium qasimii M12-11B TaxID=641524 RepID=S7WMM4_9BACT|nr:hypothetical protein ADICYQ_5384 [Cyclobacterium qasimii M12-11B]